MIWTIVGDPHARPDNLDKIGRLFDMLEELGNPVIMLGDLQDTKEVVRSSCLNLIYDRLKASKLEFVILVGNHDYFNLKCEDHSLRVLKELPNVTIVDELRYLHGIAFLPYIHDTEKARGLLKTLTPEHSIVVGHFDVKTFDFGNGYISEEGLELSDFAYFKLVISGHYHKFQVRENFVYVGTPFSHSFGETNQDKHIAILDSRTRTLEYLPTPFPRHITIEANVDGEATLEEALKAIAANEDNHVRVILSGRQENIDAFDRQAFPTVKFLEKPTNLTEFTSSVREEDSNEVKFRKWADEVKGLDLQTIELGLEILRGVN